MPLLRLEYTTESTCFLNVYLPLLQRCEGVCEVSIAIYRIEDRALCCKMAGSTSLQRLSNVEDSGG